MQNPKSSAGVQAGAGNPTKRRNVAFLDILKLGVGIGGGVWGEGGCGNLQENRNSLGLIGYCIEYNTYFPIKPKLFFYSFNMKCVTYNLAHKIILFGTFGGFLMEGIFSNFSKLSPGHRHAPHLQFCLCVFFWVFTSPSEIELYFCFISVQ